MKLEGKSIVVTGASAFRFNAFTPKQNTEYTMFINLTSLNASKKLNIGSIDANNTNSTILNVEVFLGTNKIKFITLSDTKTLRLVNNSGFGGGDVAFENVMILEGDYTNVDIPYFTGMQSVKMPVLTTSNEDGTKSNILTVNEDVELRGIGNVQDTVDCLTDELKENFIWLNFNGASKNFKVESGIQTVVNTGYTMFWVRHINDTTNNVSIIAKNTLNALLPSFNKEYNASNAPCECIASRNNGSGLNIIIKTERLGVVNHGGVVQWLEENMPPILCQLKESVVKTVDLTTVDQDGQPTKLKTFNDITYVEINADSIIPLVNVEVATKISETLSTMGLQHHDISETQNKLSQTVDEQTENTDATMMATTEIYENL